MDRFTVYMSNLYDTVTDTGHTAYKLIAGTKTGLTFATQVTKVETLRAQTTFGQLVRGLQVYGYQTTKPEALAGLYAYVTP